MSLLFFLFSLSLLSLSLSSHFGSEYFILHRLWRFYEHNRSIQHSMAFRPLLHWRSHLCSVGATPLSLSSRKKYPLLSTLFR
uniref:Secreted protein n=1 Tax=Salix viminalis TaxID=40686 RepID=A0A6N2NFF4_SALVM